MKRINFQLPFVNLFFMLLMFIFFLSGCASRVQISKKPEPGIQSAISIISHNYLQMDKFESKIFLNFKYGFIKGRVSGNLKIDLPDNINLDLKGPFGIQLGNLVTDQENFEIDIKSQDVIYGLRDTLDLAEITGIPLPEYDPITIFSPISKPPLDESFVTEFIINPDSSWSLIIQEVEYIREISINPVYGYVEEEKWFDLENNLVLEKKFLDFNLEKEIYLPDKVVYDVPGETPVTLTILYSSYKINPKWKEDPFQMKTRG